MSFDRVIAQPGAVKTLTRAVKEDRVASAYLFEGPAGIGKQLAAISLGQAMLCDRKPKIGCGDCDVCRRIGAGSHPDIRVFAPRDEGHRNIQVDFVRNEILPFTQFAPFEGRAALLIFPEADVSFPAETHAESGNALLKTLEEPRPNVHFVLLAERPHRLLPTIRSRCQYVRFSRLPPAVLERILSEHGVKEDKRAAAVALAGGRADRALALAEEGNAEALVERAMTLDKVTRENKPGTIIEISEDTSQHADLELLLETLVAFYRDVAVVGLGAHVPLAFGHRTQEVRERAKSLSPGAAADRAQKIREVLETFETNANKQIALDALLFAMR